MKMIRFNIKGDKDLLEKFKKALNGAMDVVPEDDEGFSLFVGEPCEEEDDDLVMSVNFSTKE